jgi:hypothetical protein
MKSTLPPLRGTYVNGANGSSRKPTPYRARGASWDDNFNFRCFGIGRSEDLVAREGTIPEVGGRSPESGFVFIKNAWNQMERGGKINKNKAILRMKQWAELARRLHYQAIVDAFR